MNRTGRRSIPVFKLVVLLASMAVAGVLTGCGASDHASDRASSGGASGAGGGRLTLSGASTAAPLVNEMARRYESRHPGVRIDVQTGGSSRGVADVRRGTVDIGMVSRPLGADESDLAAHRIAMDGVALIVHRDNGVSELTRQQIVDIYTGRIDNWSAVGRSSAPAAITVVNKADGRSTLELFLAHFKLKREDVRADVVIGENLHGIRTVAGDPNAIGYVSIGTAEFERSNGVPIKLLPLDGIEASTTNVLNGTFPLSRPLNLVTMGKRSPLVDAFIALATSRDVNDLVKAQFFVPIAE
jgi:phosphate transport system substrate-binding protein